MNKWVKPGSIGKAAPGYDVRIVNNMGKEVPRGEQAGGQLAFTIFWSDLKGQCHEVDIFCRSKHFDQYLFSVYALIVIKVFQNSFITVCSYFRKFLFASLKLLTNFENAY
jgi:hypothetical protein